MVFSGVCSAAILNHQGHHDHVTLKSHVKPKVLRGYDKGECIRTNVIESETLPQKGSSNEHQNMLFIFAQTYIGKVLQISI